MAMPSRNTGKPPDFVLEVASPTTARNDYTDKRLDYASFGIPEYWRFDATGGRWYDAALAGDRLVEGAYQPITIHRSAASHLWGHSAALNLTVCWGGRRTALVEPGNRPIPADPRRRGGRPDGGRDQGRCRRSPRSGIGSGTAPPGKSIAGGGKTAPGG